MKTSTVNSSSEGIFHNVSGKIVEEMLPAYFKALVKNLLRNVTQQDFSEKEIEGLCDDEIEKIVKAYSFFDRHYHVLSHPIEMLEMSNRKEIKDLFEDKTLADLSIIYHDVYESVSASADAAKAFILKIGGTAKQAKRVYENILATDHFSIPKSKDAQLICDLDLWPLAIHPDEFRRNTELLLKEKLYATEGLFKENTKKFFCRFLDRGFIYYQGYFKAKFEHHALQNILEYLKS